MADWNISDYSKPVWYKSSASMSSCRHWWPSSPEDMTILNDRLRCIIDAARHDGLEYYQLYGAGEIIMPCWPLAYNLASSYSETPSLYAEAITALTLPALWQLNPSLTMWTAIRTPDASPNASCQRRKRTYATGSSASAWHPGIRRSKTIVGCLPEGTFCQDVAIWEIHFLSFSVGAAARLNIISSRSRKLDLE